MENPQLIKGFAGYQVQLENLEQYKQNKNVEIEGTPQLANEQINDIVGKLSNLSVVPVDFDRHVHKGVLNTPPKREKRLKIFYCNFQRDKHVITFLNHFRKQVYSP